MDEEKYKGLESRVTKLESGQEHLKKDMARIDAQQLVGFQAVLTSIGEVNGKQDRILKLLESQHGIIQVLPCVTDGRVSGSKISSKHKNKIPGNGG